MVIVQDRAHRLPWCSRFQLIIFGVITDPDCLFVFIICNKIQFALEDIQIFTHIFRFYLHFG